MMYTDFLFEKGIFCSGLSSIAIRWGRARSVVSWLLWTRTGGIVRARPLHPLPGPITDPGENARLDIHRTDRLGGLLHEYQHAA